MDDMAAKGEGQSVQHDESVQEEVKRVESDDKGDGDKGSKAIEPENILSAVTAIKVLKDSSREKSIFVHGKVRTSCRVACVCHALTPHLPRPSTVG